MPAHHIETGLAETLLRHGQPDLVDRAVQTGFPRGSLPGAAIGLVPEDLQRDVGARELAGDGGSSSAGAPSRVIRSPPRSGGRAGF